MGMVVLQWNLYVVARRVLVLCDDTCAVRQCGEQPPTMRRLLRREEHPPRKDISNLYYGMEVKPTVGVDDGSKFGAGVA